MPWDSTLFVRTNEKYNHYFIKRSNKSKEFHQQLSEQLEVLLSGSEIKVEIDGQIAVKPEDKFELLRAIKELVLNAKRHSNCKKIKISLWKVVKFDKVVMDYYVNEMYTVLLKKLTSEIDSLKIDKNYPTSGSYCDLLSTINKSSVNLNY